MGEPEAVAAEVAPQAEAEEKPTPIDADADAPAEPEPVEAGEPERKGWTSKSRRHFAVGGGPTGPGIPTAGSPQKNEFDQATCEPSPEDPPDPRAS